MPLLLETHDYLPHIDEDPTESESKAAAAAIAAELDTTHTKTLHSSIETTYEPTFSPAIIEAHKSIASTGAARPKDTGIDLTRYEEPTVPDESQSRTQWQSALRAAFVSHSYLSQRHVNLSLLERYGKNAWLIANSQVEEELRTLEREVAEAERQIEAVEEERRQSQQASKGELEGLDEAWRKGVGRAIEAEVAAEGLRREILERRRAG